MTKVVAQHPDQARCDRLVDRVVERRVTSPGKLGGGAVSGSWCFLCLFINRVLLT